MKEVLYMKAFLSAVRRILPLLLVGVIVLGMAPAASASSFAYSYSDVESARRLALDCLMTCGFSQEYGANGENGQGTVLTRWEDTIKIHVSGSPSQSDLSELDEFIMECATHCPNMPNIRLVNSDDQANVTIWYGPLDQLQYHSEYYVEGNWGYFSYWSRQHQMSRGEIVIATDVNTTDSKNHLLREELMGVFGLTNDQSVYSDSILYTEWTTTQELSDVDWLMLNMLYDPDLSTGMSGQEARGILERKIAA